MNKIKLLSLTLLVLVVTSSNAFNQPAVGQKNANQLTYRKFMYQHIRWEAGFSVGAANSMTDIAASKTQTQASITDVYFRGLSPALSVYSRYRFSKAFSLRGNINALLLRGNDRWSPNLEIVSRGKSFTNSIFETNLLTEFYLPKNELRPKLDFNSNLLDLFVFAGISAFYHSPKVDGPIIDDFDADLLERENAYNNIQMAIPLGVGLQWTMAQRWVLGLDVNFRYTFFDYLDGFRRPYSNRNDYFFTSNVSFGYIIGSRRSGKAKINTEAPHVFGPNDK